MHPLKKVLALTRLASAFVVAVMPLAAQAGAWTPATGSAYQKVAVNSFSSDSTFGNAAVGVRKFTDINLTYYAEFGLRDSLALFVSVPFKRLSSQTALGSASTTGVGDVDLGLRYRLYGSGPLVLSTAWLYKAPWAYDRQAAVALGNGQNDVEGRLLLGYSLGSAGYLGVEAGLRYRAGAPADEARYLLEYGLSPSDKLYLRGKYDVIKGLQNSTGPRAVAGNPNLNLEFDLSKLELTAGWKLGRNLSTEISGTRNLTGDNTLRGTNYSVALVYAY